MMQAAASILLVATLARTGSIDALLFTNPPRHDHQHYPRITNNKQLNYRATTDDTETDTWSKSAQGESRLGVRRRVRAVLARARQRTGVANDSEQGSTDRLSLLTSDSNLGLEATMDWAAIDDMMDEPSVPAPDWLDSDATLSLGAASPQEFERAAAQYTHNNGKMSFNGKSAKPAFTTTTSTAIRTAAPMESLRGGQGAPLSASASGHDEREPSSEQDAEKQPLPFSLPVLSPQQKQALESGERVQEQYKMAGEGSGFVVMDIPAPAYAIWETLLDFETYPENIGTVRSMTMFTNTHLKQSLYAEKPLYQGDENRALRHYGKASISRAMFVLSKFRLNIAAVHRYQPHPDGHFMVFTLDKATKNVVLRDAKGIWYTESNPDGRQGITRVWLLCELKVSPLLPKFIVDYAAKRAMPRATTWLPGVVQRFLDQEEGTNGDGGGGSANDRQR